MHYSEQDFQIRIPSSCHPMKQAAKINILLTILRALPVTLNMYICPEGIGGGKVMRHHKQRGFMLYEHAQ